MSESEAKIHRRLGAAGFLRLSRTGQSFGLFKPNGTEVGKKCPRAEGVRGRKPPPHRGFDSPKVGGFLSKKRFLRVDPTSHFIIFSKNRSLRVDPTSHFIIFPKKPPAGRPNAPFYVLFHKKGPRGSTQRHILCFFPKKGPGGST